MRAQQYGLRPPVVSLAALDQPNGEHELSKFFVADLGARRHNRFMTSDSQLQDVTIRRWTEIADTSRLTPQVDAIFFESSGTKTFADDAHRQTFRERWLGRYLRDEPEWAYVALDGDNTVAGYLVGSITDPATTGPYDDIGAFANFADLTSAHPAHLHVNLAPPFRNRGLGGRLIEAFVSDATRADAKGAHVITGATSRNVGFYKRNGFRELATGKIRNHGVVLLGRALRPA